MGGPKLIFDLIDKTFIVLNNNAHIFSTIYGREERDEKEIAEKIVKIFKTNLHDNQN